MKLVDRYRPALMGKMAKDKRSPTLAEFRADGTCAHFFDNRLCCDGREHYYPCVVKGCNARQYFCKHTRNYSHCPREKR